MAWTADVIDRFNVANKRVHVLSCTADATTQNVDTGLDVVDHFLITPQSGATAALVAYPNVLAAGTASPGYIGFSAAVSGDVFYLYVFGR